MRFQAAAIQLFPVLKDVRANRQKMLDALVKMKEGYPEASLAVFPELMTTGYRCGESFYSLAETLDRSESVQQMARICRELKIHVVFGMAERDPQAHDIIYNSAVVLNDRGELLGTYRKVHPTAKELIWFKAGSTYPLFSTRLGNLGAFICWDTAFPEVARIYALKGADILTISSAWEHPFSSVWDLATSARALDNVLPIIAANRCGKDEDYDCFGHSRILDPLGCVLAKLDQGTEGFIIAEIDTNETPRLRQQYFTFLKDRRPDTYGLLSASSPPSRGDPL